MKEYNLIGRDIGIVVQADSLEEAIQKAEDILLQGYGGYIETLDEKVKLEYSGIPTFFATNSYF